jgi:hypothetical protein
MSSRAEVQRITQATADLMRRSGAIEFRMGQEGESWYAVALYPDDKMVKESGVNPVRACMLLAFEVLDGTLCRRCHRPVTIVSGDGAFCVWTIENDRWRAGCGQPVDEALHLVPKVA